jgi:hypothetical protein
MERTHTKEEWHEINKLKRKWKVLDRNATKLLEEHTNHTEYYAVRRQMDSIEEELYRKFSEVV